MSTRKQYFRGVLKYQNDTWKAIYRSEKETYYGEEFGQDYRFKIVNSLALAHTRIYCYITSEHFVECDRNIDNVYPPDVESIVWDYFSLHKHKLINYKHKARLTYNIYSDIFPDSDLTFREYYEASMFSE